jgi:hypothetical protein
MDVSQAVTAKPASMQPADLPEVPRAVTALGDDGAATTALLSEWRELDAFVLLGDPGSGKSRSMQAECTAVGGTLCTARDLIALGPAAVERGKTVFIDGLDEVRAGGGNGNMPLDAIRKALLDLGRPRFRLSCREHDWRAQTDLAALRQVAPNGVIRELHLEPLSLEEQRLLLASRLGGSQAAGPFIERAQAQGLVALLGNPLLLDLMTRAVGKSGWPDSRNDVYARACRELAAEHSQTHLQARPPVAGQIDRMLDDAGLLCALLLLSGKTFIAQPPSDEADAVLLHTLTADLNFSDAPAALASKLFTTSAGKSKPLHRSMAEYLAARAIARRVQDKGLPQGRVLALMQGADGRVVEPLRGLLGWLAVHDASHRKELIALEPLSVVLNGDVSAFAPSDKTVLLQALRDEAQRNPWFRNQQWVSYPFGPLASPEMSQALAQVLADHSTDRGHQQLVDCVLDALRHGTPLPELGAALEGWVEDEQADFMNRIGALEAWARCRGLDVAKATDWLEKLHDGSLKDKDARLAGALLQRLYPEHIGPQDVLRYWPRPGAISSNSMPPHFWCQGLLDRSGSADFARLADAWGLGRPQTDDRDPSSSQTQLASQILARALQESGDDISDERLHAWLQIGIDQYGFSKLDHEEGGKAVTQWLTERPARQKAVVALGWYKAEPEPDSGRRHFWEAERLLHGAQRPRDWLFWLLEQAANAPNDELARYCFAPAAHAPVDPPIGFDVPTMEQIADWVEAHIRRWPSAAEWLTRAWQSVVDEDWRGKQHRGRRKREAERLASRQARKEGIAPFLESLLNGTAPANVLHQLVGAYQKRFYDIHGETPEQRVQDFLVSDESTAVAAIAALAHVLQRPDLPSAEEVLALDRKGQYHPTRPAALLAARLAHEREPAIVDKWSAPLLSSLVASYLTEGLGDIPQWYRSAVVSKPTVVAKPFVSYVLKCFRQKGPTAVTGLWALAREPSQSDFARLVLPPLLEGFPQRASEPARGELNRSLLGALHLLDDATAAAIVRRKLNNPSMDAAQRVSWLVADIHYRPDAAERLVEWVGKNERRAVALGIALYEQQVLSRPQERLRAEVLSSLIELLAPITSPDRLTGVMRIGATEHRKDSVRALIAALASKPDAKAASELARLQQLPRLLPWRELLRYSLISQQGVAREAHFRHPTPEAVAQTLAHRAPANQADLQALTLDHLQDLGRRFKEVDTFATRQFWTDGKPQVPKEENYCRDLLLEQLRSRLAPLGIHVESEARAAADKRADMRVGFNTAGFRLALPVEVKKEDHRDIWIAWREQLQRLYSNDPDADGFGIYLVLWFGHKPRSSPQGEKPPSAAVLAQWLSELIPEKDRVRLKVCVLDLSLAPAPAPRQRPRP